MTFLEPAVELVETLGADILGLGEEIADQIRDRGEAHIPVDSTAIASLAYRGDRTCTIVFTDGRRYAMTDFPARLLAEWLGSESIGAFYNRNIRGKY